MVHTPLVSIVTPCFNGAAFLEGYFEGLLSQTYTNIEVVFVDDGSTDATEAVFRAAEPSLRERFSGGVRYIRQRNTGPVGAVNAGYAAATGELLAPCDSDDIMLPNRIADHVACLADHPECSLVYGDYLFCDEDGLQRGKTGMADWPDPPQGEAVYEALLRHGMFIKCGAYCFRRECLGRLPNSRLNEAYPGQNLELLLRVSHRGKVAFHSTPVVKIIERKGSITRPMSVGNLQHAIRSKRIVDEVIADLGCSRAVHRTVELRYLPGELRYYLVTGDSRQIRSCVLRAVRLGVFRRYLLGALVASFLPAGRKWLLRRKYPDLAAVSARPVEL